jgi:hypothetical protein
MTAWNSHDDAIRLPPVPPYHMVATHLTSAEYRKYQIEFAEALKAIGLDGPEPSREDFTMFLRVIEAMNDYQRPDPDSACGRVWKWLEDQAR